uniref:Uncharacterized protein n=1 Tax=Arundo donax TaxID=35708 RepID=A0A0A9BG93_ARUDO
MRASGVEVLGTARDPPICRARVFSSPRTRWIITVDVLHSEN